MTLQTGNKKKGLVQLLRKGAGFTFIEVMVATAVLSLGIVLIFQGFFICLDSSNYCSSYLNISSWMNEKIWEAEDGITRYGTANNIPTVGDFVKRKKDFKWNITYNIMDRENHLYKIGLFLSWKESGRAITLSRNTYAIHEIKE